MTLSANLLKMHFLEFCQTKTFMFVYHWKKVLRVILIISSQGKYILILRH